MHMPKASINRRKVTGAVASIGLLAAACGSSAGTSKAAGSTAASTPATTAVGAQATSSGPIDISVWTAFNGVLGKAFNHLVDGFNASQSTYHLTATYKGSYSQVLSDTIAAFRAHAAPDISQIFDAGTATIMDAAGTYVPVYKLMAQNNIPFSTSDFVGGAASYYETSADQLDSLPFNSSTPVLFYNKTELANAGITSPPSTWTQLQADANILSAHGQHCSLTSSGAYVMWTDMEQFAVWNGYPYASNDNGYTAIKGVTLQIDTPPFVSHLSMLGQMASKGQYMWNGVSTSTVPLFTNGTCAMYEQSSADLTTIQAGAKFPFGVSE
ncbi:MAG: extracellular solute-binding protein, partial [Gallionella sp.]|nr:extracellular solute-binding protein [Gallionella sp.]